MLAAAELRNRELSRTVADDRDAGYIFFAGWALLFFASAAFTILNYNAMSAMGEMPMPGGWTMSMAWMRMPGESWTGAAGSFLAMWLAMMVAMMLPSLVPKLWHYRRALAMRGEARAGSLTAVVGVGYFFVWTAIGAAIFPMGTAIARLEMRQPLLARAVPTLAGAIVILAGVTQFTPWKAHNLECCRQAARRTADMFPSNAASAWQLGARLGRHCSCACASLTVVLLIFGVMNLAAMAAVTAAITAEHLAPGGERVARAVGAVLICAGLLWIAQGARLG